ncbi:ChbG/HpnK family deacetylase [Enterococcus pseudoavium]|uniref:ChbG/HpnK family deacetylase n=1 Tax=Enterococcus pseudoavium TaxID=44007 RepID=UPI0008379EA0|nr:ChbG/HpnK family deacetylase [Enterococcus pseudoavium]
MRKFILNADDLGLSEAINLGIAKSIRDGLVNSTSLMVNLPEASAGVQLVQAIDPDFEINLHINFTLGQPVSKDTQAIASLLTENGEFLSSSHYKNGGTLRFDYQEIKKEMEAQILRFQELLGYLPVHMETHSVGDEAVGQALYELAKKYGIHANLFYGYQPPKELPYQAAQIPDFSKLMTVLNRGTTLADFSEDHFGYQNLAEEIVVELHLHPGFIDQYLLDHSSLTLPRCKDLVTLTSAELKDWFAKTDNQIVNFSSLR